MNIGDRVHVISHQMVSRTFKLIGFTDDGRNAIVERNDGKVFTPDCSIVLPIETRNGITRCWEL